MEVFGQTRNSAKRFSTCLICGQRLRLDEGFPLANARGLRHKNCSKQKVILELCAQAQRLGMSALELLTGRLEELQGRVLQALGAISFEQFQTAEPAGYLHLFVSGSDLRVKLVFSRHVQSEAMYVEALITPAELPLQKERLLLRFREQASGQAGSIGWSLSEGLLGEWLMLADWLRHAEEHWNGRNKKRIAREVLATELVQFKVLKWTGIDVALAGRPLLPKCPELGLIAREMLSAEELKAAGR